MMLPSISPALIARAAVVLIIISGAAWWHCSAVESGRAEVRAEDAAALAAHQRKADSEIGRLTQLNRDTSHAYAEKLEQVKTDADRLRAELGAVRVRFTAASHRSPVPAAPNAAGRTDAATGIDELHREVAADNLVTLVEQCEQQRQQLIGLQRWAGEAQR